MVKYLILLVILRVHSAQKAGFRLRKANQAVSRARWARRPWVGVKIGAHLVPGAPIDRRI